MALIQWNESLSVNVAEIDHQHQVLIGMINELHEAMRLGKGKEVLGKIIQGMVNYTATHFKTEEKYFDLFGYPAAEAHKQEHATFIRKVSEFRDGFEAGKLGLSLEVMNFLSDWLQKHIKGSDQRYGPWFNAKGLQ